MTVNNRFFYKDKYQVSIAGSGRLELFTRMQP